LPDHKTTGSTVNHNGQVLSKAAQARHRKEAKLPVSVPVAFNDIIAEIAERASISSHSDLPSPSSYHHNAKPTPRPYSINKDDAAHPSARSAVPLSESADDARNNISDAQEDMPAKAAMPLADFKVSAHPSKASHSCRRSRFLAAP
jgi:hypothetical protein